MVTNYHTESFEVIAGEEASFIAGPYTDQGFGIGSNGFPGFKPSAAGKFSRQNYAFYVDVEAQFTEDFLMGYAIRYEDYSSFGDTTNFKVTAQYNITDDFSLRGSVSTGFRAPTVGQANYANVQTNLDGGVLVDSALLPPTNAVAVQLGANELTPEESKSMAFGAVWSVNDFHFTLDYYNIEVTDRVSQSAKLDLSAEDKAILKADGVPNVDSIQQVSFFLLMTLIQQRKVSILSLTIQQLYLLVIQPLALLITIIKPLLTTLLLTLQVLVKSLV